MTDNYSVCSTAGTDWHQINHKAPHYWPFVRGFLQWPMDSPHKGQVMRNAYPCHCSRCQSHITHLYLCLRQKHTLWRLYPIVIKKIFNWKKLLQRLKNLCAGIIIRRCRGELVELGEHVVIWSSYTDRPPNGFVAWIPVVWIRNHIHYEVWDEINCPLSNFNGAISIPKLQQCSRWSWGIDK